MVVALRKESVDRNTQRRDFKRLGLVALRKESVDRNSERLCNALKHLWSLSARRAWIEIIDDLEPSSTRKLSLSARRAWIEIPLCLCGFSAGRVALRKESVDRNMLYDTSALMKCQSLSARRAWIEMAVLCLLCVLLLSLSARRAWIEIGLFGVDKISCQVALRKESVDRN